MPDLTLTPDDTYAGLVFCFNIGRRDYAHLLARSYLDWAETSGQRVDPVRLAKAVAVERATRTTGENQ